MLPQHVQASPATDVLSRAVTKLKGYKSITASYAISGAEGVENGVIVVDQRRFLIDSPGMKVWYDGKTQWTFLPQEKEVTVTEPAADELRQINPFAVIEGYSGNYEATLLKSTEPGKSVVELKPRGGRSNDGISRAVVTFDSSTLLPEKVVLTMSSRSVVTIRISSLTDSGKQNPARFKPHPNQFPGCEVIDLR